MHFEAERRMHLHRVAFLPFYLAGPMAKCKKCHEPYAIFHPPVVIYIFFSYPSSSQQVNCGGRAQKVGLKVNDEIMAVNNLDVDKHPLTLDRSAFNCNGNGNEHGSGGKQQGNQGNVSNELAVSPGTNDGPPPSTCPPLTKLDFTYQLIKHTLNRQLHLTVRRFVLLNCNGELTELTDLDELGASRNGRFQSCCYYVDDQDICKEANGKCFHYFTQYTSYCQWAS